MNKKAIVFFTAFLFVLLLVACNDTDGYQKADAEQQGKSETVSQNGQQ